MGFFQGWPKVALTAAKSLSNTVNTYIVRKIILIIIVFWECIC